MTHLQSKSITTVQPHYIAHKASLQIIEVQLRGLFSRSAHVITTSIWRKRYVHIFVTYCQISNWYCNLWLQCRESVMRALNTIIRVALELYMKKTDFKKNAFLCNARLCYWPSSNNRGCYCTTKVATLCCADKDIF